MALGRVVAEPVLQERRAAVEENDRVSRARVLATGWKGMGMQDSLQRRGTEGVEAEALARMHDGQLARHGQNGALAGRVRQLRRPAPDQGDDTGRVDDAAVGLSVFAQTQHRVLAAEPDALDVDRVRQVPNLLGGVDGVGVERVHDPRVVEHDVDAAPVVEVRDRGGDGGLGRHVALDRLE